jgi:hypothetical protein
MRMSDDKEREHPKGRPSGLVTHRLRLPSTSGGSMKRVLLLWLAGFVGGGFVGWGLALLAFPGHVPTALSWGAVIGSFITARWGYYLRNKAEAGKASSPQVDVQ